ncbi:MAG: pyridoxal phosphate enzyme (YggS family) [Zhongshania sp.]|jgi:pyridoxal phosphate enzyme (YggS family)
MNTQTIPSIAVNIAAIVTRISAAVNLFPNHGLAPILMAVSKTRSAEEVRAAVIAGASHIGENYLQEALSKQQALRDLDIVWHFIGPLQTNKTRAIASNFDWVHGVDRDKIIIRLNDQRPPELGPLNICLQVNINDEASKSGAASADLPALLELALRQPMLRVRGLMAIPANASDPQQQRQQFAVVNQLFRQLQAQFPSAKLDTLSMGMSGDMEAAIAEGATIVRIGSDIFGPRRKSDDE